MSKASGSKLRQRNRSIAIRLLPSEAAVITAAAERAGLSRGAYVRFAALGNPGPRAVRRPPVEKAELARLLGELGKLGSNLNQIARVANSACAAPQLSELAALNAHLVLLRNAIMEALGRQP